MSSLRMFLLFSHKLTQSQIEDAKTLSGFVMDNGKSVKKTVSEFVLMPDDLAKRWANVPSDVQYLDSHLNPIVEWLLENAQRDDYVLITGDFGATYLFVEVCRINGFIPVYATTERKSVEIQNEDGTTETKRIFEHVMFRRFLTSYQQCEYCGRLENPDNRCRRESCQEEANFDYEVGLAAQMFEK